MSTWAPVVVVAMLSQTEIGQSSPWTGSAAGRAIGGLALALPLAWVARAPVAAAVGVALAVLAQIPLGDSLSFAAFLAVLVAVYGLGRHATSRWGSMFGLCAITAGAVTAGTLDEGQVTPDVLIPLIYVAVVFGLGRLVRRLSHQAEQLRRLNAGLLGQREQEARLAVAAERLRISRELHDVVAHRIMLMVIQAEAGEETLLSNPSAARASLGRIQEAGRDGLDDLRRLVRVLRTEEGEAAPSLGDLEALVTVMREARLDVDLDREGDFSSVPPAVQETGLRIVQEALTNVLKHSSAGTATVVVEALPGAADQRSGLMVDVYDPGPPTDDWSARAGGGPGAGESGRLGGGEAEGQGLRGMAERLAGHGGVLEAGAERSGFRVVATVPPPGMIRIPSSTVVAP